VADHQSTDEELARAERGRVAAAGECGVSDGYAKCTNPEIPAHRVHWDRYTQHEFVTDDEEP
jgi:hypothetical protein